MMCTPEYSVRVPEYQESIFEKVIEPLQRWQNAPDQSLYFRPKEPKAN